MEIYVIERKSGFIWRRLCNSGRMYPARGNPTVAGDYSPATYFLFCKCFLWSDRRRERERNSTELSLQS